MFERQYEDLYIDPNWDDEYDYNLPDYDHDYEEGWWEDDYDYLDEEDEELPF